MYIFDRGILKLVKNENITENKKLEEKIIGGRIWETKHISKHKSKHSCYLYLYI
jgi:hypothetical protein